MESSLRQMGSFTKGIWRMVEETVTESLPYHPLKYTRADLWEASKTVVGKNNSRLETAMKGTTFLESFQAKVVIDGPTVQCISASSIMVVGVERVIGGQLTLLPVILTMVNTKTTKNAVKDSILGKQELVMRDNSWTTWDKVRELFATQTERSSEPCGRMESESNNSIARRSNSTSKQENEQSQPTLNRQYSPRLADRV